MAISSSYSYNPDLTSLAKLSMRTAGVLGDYEDPTGEEVQSFADWLNAELKEWQAAGRLLRQVERVTKTLTAGTATVTVDADTIDVEFPAYVTLTSSSTSTYEVDRMTLDEYMRISNKTQQGIPTRALVERKDSVVMTLHPVPDSTVSSITYVRAKLIRDLASGTTADVNQRVIKAVVLAGAVWLAEKAGKSADKIDRLERRAEQAKQTMFKDNTERGGFRFTLR